MSSGRAQTGCLQAAGCRLTLFFWPPLALCQRGQDLQLRLASELIGAVSEEELGEISFVRLEPIQAVGGDGADVEAIDVHRVGQIIDPGGIGGQGRTDEGLTDRFDHVLLRALDDRDEREHVLFGRDPSSWRVGM